jgi:hypothetical protein
LLFAKRGNLLWCAGLFQNAAEPSLASITDASLHTHVLRQQNSKAKFLSILNFYGFFLIIGLVFDFI